MLLVSQMIVTSKLFYSLFAYYLQQFLLPFISASTTRLESDNLT